MEDKIKKAHAAMEHITNLMDILEEAAAQHKAEEIREVGWNFFQSMLYILNKEIVSATTLLDEYMRSRGD